MHGSIAITMWAKRTQRCIWLHTHNYHNLFLCPRWPEKVTNFCPQKISQGNVLTFRSHPANQTFSLLHRKAISVNGIITDKERVGKAQRKMCNSFKMAFTNLEVERILFFLHPNLQIIAWSFTVLATSLISSLGLLSQTAHSMKRQNATISKGWS